MNGLVDDLLDVSRIQQGHLELRLAPCDLGAVVEEIVEEQRALWPARAIVLERGDAPAPVYADPDRIGQVVTNFVTNALKYSDEDRSVRVDVARQGAEVCVRVRDEGPGLTVEEQATLWERFRRVHGVTVRSEGGGAGGGIGLGLYISKMLVEEHQGRVGIDSAPGVGSTFYFCLPLQEAP